MLRSGRALRASVPWHRAASSRAPHLWPWPAIAAAEGGEEGAATVAAAAAAADDGSMVDLATIVALCRRRGFVYPSAALYGGRKLRGTFDYGPLGAELKRNVKDAWWMDMVTRRADVVGLDAALLTAPAVLRASGHVAGFVDPMCDCLRSRLRFRADHVLCVEVFATASDEGDGGDGDGDGDGDGEGGASIGWVSVLEGAGADIEAAAAAAVAGGGGGGGGDGGGGGGEPGDEGGEAKGPKLLLSKQDRKRAAVRCAELLAAGHELGRWGGAGAGDAVLLELAAEALLAQHYEARPAGRTARTDSKWRYGAKGGAGGRLRLALPPTPYADLHADLWALVPSPVTSGVGERAGGDGGAEGLPVKDGGGGGGQEEGGGEEKQQQKKQKKKKKAKAEQPLGMNPALTGAPGSMTAPRDFNLMLETRLGAAGATLGGGSSQEGAEEEEEEQQPQLTAEEAAAAADAAADASGLAYLRPETAQGIFTNYKEVATSARMRPPFGIAQVGKAFRNEITPRHFLFRVREFEQMELEYFTPADNGEGGHEGDAGVRRRGGGDGGKHAGMGAMP
jgi:hypothetical protein